MCTRITFLIGGPAFHPVDKQARAVQGWLDSGCAIRCLDGIDALEPEVLRDTDLLVIMGLHWTGMNVDWAGNLVYRPMEDRHKEAFERYVSSGKPILAHHGGIASYNDWMKFGALLGITWVWGFTSHSPFGKYKMRALDTGHATVRDIGEYELEDEIYHTIAINADAAATVHCVVEWQGVLRPMVISLEGGRAQGAGRVVYLANGHDMKAYECDAMRKLWVNSVGWLLE